MTFCTRSLAIVLALALAGCVTSQKIHFSSSTDTVWGSDTTSVPGLFFKPEGPGPFPAVVLLYTDAGMLPHVSEDWPRFLTAHGYAVLTVDSYTPRNLNVRGMGSIKQRMQAKDAYGALDYLAGRPDVDPERIAVMGFSNGALAVGEFIMRTKPRKVGQRNFAAAVSVYGRCQGLVAADRDYIPLLLIVAENDNLLKADCIRAIQSEGFEGAVIKGAFHAFDIPSSGNHSPDAYGNRMMYSEPAAAEARELARGFLARQLKKAN